MFHTSFNRPEEQPPDKQAVYKPESYRVASNPSMEQNGSLHVLFAGESQTLPNHRLGPKVYSFYLMHIVLSGRGSYVTEHERYQLKAGDTFLIRPNQLISYESDANDPWHYRWVAFTGDEANQLVALAGFQPTCEVVSLDDYNHTASSYQQILEAFREGHVTSSIRASGLLQLIMSDYGKKQLPEAQLLPSSSHAEQQLHKQMVHYLTSQYTHPVSIEHMAEAFGYNRAYLSRLFKQKVGMPPSTFLLNLRLDHARHLLRERPELTIEQVSASVGIQDALYFSKQFRKAYQQSPTSYRKQVLED
ncbi:AraC family transcriptional regulator [Paenibacillus sp. FSL W7-1287]|uniref:AraC family transcriptional regulator n=1 Tax=Paenibacillus sp. FSL W7-1287 TaxID=2954538 RepID=UPI0030F72F27